MAYSEAVAERIRVALAPRRDVVEKKMFGGVAFMISGAMAIGVVKDELMVRVGPDAHDSAVARPHARVMDFTGKPMRGFVFVSPLGFKTSAQLARWVTLAVEFVTTEATRSKAKRPSRRKKLTR